MQIELGKIYVNKTYKYLLPCLKMHGPTFVVKLNSIFNLAFGLHDCLLDGSDYQQQKLIYILSDKLYQPAKFQNFLNYVKCQDYYVTDYAYDDIEKGRKHMVVIKFPEKYNDIYDKFKKGKYSKMYCKDEIEQFFPKDSEVKRILVKSLSMRDVFIQKVFDSFGTTLSHKDLKDENIEYDFPPEKQKEFFNYQYLEE